MAEPGVGVEQIDELNIKLANMTMVQLKQELRKRKLKTVGLKNELILKLFSFMQLEREHGATECDDGQVETTMKMHVKDEKTAAKVIQTRMMGTTHQSLEIGVEQKKLGGISC